MRLVRTIACCLVIFLYLPASGQSTRWLLSFNPLGLLEPKGALGVGVGVKLNKYVELWSETSLLRTVIYAGDSSLTGVRQIVQIKYFPHGYPDFFVAAEVRYKTYQYRVGDEFFNPTTSLYLEASNNLCLKRKGYRRATGTPMWTRGMGWKMELRRLMCMHRGRYG